MDTPDSESNRQSDGAPDVSAVYRYLVYGLSLPERTLRGTSGLVGGALRESAALVVPTAFRNSKSYQTFVEQMLNFMCDDVAGVNKGSADSAADENAPPPVENYVARKAVSSFVDLAGLATLHLSPLVLLAVVSDVAHGSKSYLHELSEELKKEGLIGENSTIDSTSELLEVIGGAAGQSADAFDTPPISMDGLQDTIDQLTESVKNLDPSKVIPLAEIDRMWSEMSSLATQQEVSLFEVSSAMTLFTMRRLAAVTTGALSTVRVAGGLLDRHVFDHYRNGLSEIGSRGIYSIVAESSQPYIDAMWSNFSTERETLTEGLVSGRLIGNAWQGMRAWFCRKDDDLSPTDTAPESDPPSA